MRLAPALTLALLLLAARACAAPSGLNTIPTADVVPARQFVFQLQNGNTAIDGPPTAFGQPQPAFMAQAGMLAGRIEAGVDLVAPDDPHDYRAVANLKVVPLVEGDAWPSLAAGVQLVGRGAAPTYYAVATRTLNYASLQYQKFRAHHRNRKLHGFRVHAGVVGTRSDPRALLGSDLELSEHAVLNADWIAGHGQSATLGGGWIVNSQLSLQAAVLVDNDERRVNGLQVQLSRTVAW